VFSPEDQAYRVLDDIKSQFNPCYSVNHRNLYSSSSFYFWEHFKVGSMVILAFDRKLVLAKSVDSKYFEAKMDEFLKVEKSLWRV
jgi:hypothetical protein